jgi:uncharacterized protein (TIGR03435 family)
MGSACGPCQQKIRCIAAGDEQDERNGSQQYPHQPPNRSNGTVAKRLDVRSPASQVTLQWVGLGAGSEAVGPSLPTALEEQLGLKLTATKGPPVGVVVIDSIDRPSEN